MPTNNEQERPVNLAVFARPDSMKITPYAELERFKACSNLSIK
jgi:hypothetical protein